MAYLLHGKIMVADHLIASAPNILTTNNRNIPISAPEGLTNV